jgi:diguanylate cyclase (GGDEF)-like protein
VDRIGAATVAACALVGLAHLSGAGGFDVQLTLYRVAAPPLAVAITALYWCAGGTGTTAPRARLTLRLIAAAFAVVSVLAVARWWISRTSQPGAYPLDFPVGAVGDLFALGFGVAAALSIPTRQGDRPHRVRLAIDMGTVLVAALTVVWYVTAPDRPPDGGAVSLTVTIFPTAVLLVAIAAVARVLISGVVGMRPLTLLLPVAGCFFEASSAFVVPALAETRWNHLSLLTSPAMVACFAAGAMLHARFATHPDRLRPRTARAESRTYSLLPYLAVVAVFALLVIAWARADLSRGRPVVVGAAIVTALVTTRQVMAFRDNDRLTRTLRHAAHSDDILLTAANALISAPDAGTVLAHAAEAADALLAGTGGAAVILTGPAEPHDARRESDLPLAADGSAEVAGVLRISWEQPLPQETLRALSALQHQVDLALTTVSLRQQLTHRASHDPLTGLANRAQLHHLLDHLAAEPGGRTVAVLLVDLDGFKAVNDTAGHTAGDAVLREVAERLRGAVRPRDVVCRLGGDEFTVVLTEVTAAEAEDVRERIRSAVAEPFVVGGREHRIGASVGAAVTTTDALDPDRLLHDADLEMYRVKAARKARVPVA